MARITSYQKQTEEQTAKINSYQKQTEEQTAKINSYQKQTEEQTAKINSYQKQTEEQAARINSYQKQTEEQTAKIDYYQKQTEEQAAKIASYQKQTEEQKIAIASYQEREEKQKINLKEEEFLNEEIVSYIVEIGRSRKSQATREDLRKLEKKIEEYYPSMRELVRRYDISKTDYQLCQLIKLGLRPAEIGYIMEISLQNISTKRREMHKKIFGKLGHTTDFDQYILNIACGSETLPET